MQHKPIPNVERLIFAMDIPDCDRARELVGELGDAVRFYKIGLELMMSGAYFELLDWMLERDKKVFCDLKFFDIPATVGSAVRQLKDRGATFVTVHGNKSIMEAAAENKGDNLKVLGVTVLTSLDQQDLDCLGIQESLTERVVRRAEMAERVGLDGVIASGLEAHAIRDAIPNSNFLIVTPGIRPKGSTKHEQKRTCTPYEAVGNGADYLVVGRPIIQSDQKMDTVLEITKGMQKAFDERAAHRQKRRPSRGGASDYR